MHSPAWLSRTSNSSRHAERYREGRIFLAGDAAHIHLPAGGQGLNVGLQDATNLAWKLAAEVAGWAPAPVVAGEFGYDTERRPVAEQLVANTLAQDALFNTFGPAGAALRGMFSDFIARGGEVAAELSGWVSGVGVGYESPDGMHPLVGSRAPELELTTGSLLRTLRQDKFLLVEFTGGDAPTSASASLAGPRVQVAAARPVEKRHPSRGAAWHGVRAALIRPDGHVAYATETGSAFDDAVRAWTQPAAELVRGS